MGRIDENIFSCLIIACLLLPLTAKTAEMEDANVVLTDFKLPEYNKDTKKLEFIVYGDKARTVGVLVNLEGVKIELVEDDIKKVKATVTSPTAIYDRATKIVKGDDEVYMKSPEMDAEGVGFDSDYEKQIIHIRSKVKVTLKGDLGTMYKEQTGSEK